ncbi:hypothetical protein RSOLAG22IIIB_11139 [Rhizoctonia solani]|uniref:Uncharacterized protein n=1 Tax=Rhizoctonia solani TaxID=456999 RepID=A0A0K6G757_9AGAM|nr:hypothetical protein RSOLAG22IIIB_11139 [Rhizoctonia solani]
MSPGPNRGIEQLLALVAGTKIYVDTEDNMQIFIAHKSLTDEDLGRFKFYAPFVKRLDSFKMEKYFRYRLRGWKQLLTALGNSPLLPNLRTLIFNTRPTTTMFEQQAWFMLLLSPSLHELHLATTSSHRTLNASAAELFFKSISTTLQGATDSPSSPRQSPPARQTVTISTESADVEDISWLTTIRDLAGLSKLVISLSTLGAGKFTTIGLLSQLESLEIDFDIHHEGSVSQYISLDLPDNAFSRLRHFGLKNLPDTSSFQTIWSMTHLTSHLTSLSLHFNKYRWMNVLTYDQIMSDFISPIGEKSPNLVDLVIHPPEYEWNEAGSSAPMFDLLSRLPLVRLQFAPMLGLHMSIPHTAGKYPLLKRLKLATSWVAVADVKNLAVVFPNLEYLAIQIIVYPEDFQGAISVSTSSQPIVIHVLSVFLEEDPLWDRAIIGDRLAGSVSITITSQ